MRVLVTSASAKLPLLRSLTAEIRQAHPDAAVIAGDSDPACLAAYAWEPFLAMPLLRATGPEQLIDLLRSEGVDAVVPTRDAELPYFAAIRAPMAAAGIAVLVSPPAAIEACIDKARFADVLGEAGLPVIPTSDRLDDPRLGPGPYVVKERQGSGAAGIGLRLAHDVAAAAADRLAQPIFQPFIEGGELSIDAYRSRDGRTLGIIARSRDVVRHGESQVTTTVDPVPFSALVTAVLDATGVEGHAVIQVLVGDQGVHVIECNPRLGGASTLSMAAGLRSVTWFLREAQGLDPAVVPFRPRPTPLRLVRTPVDDISDPRP